MPHFDSLSLPFLLPPPPPSNFWTFSRRWCALILPLEVAATLPTARSQCFERRGSTLTGSAAKSGTLAEEPLALPLGWGGAQVSR